MDVAKIGMSTDPVGRMNRLHRCYFEFFDLDRAVLLEMESVRDARAIEAALKSEFSDATISAPLAVADDAGGKHEWFLGISNSATVALQRHAEATGYPLHPSMAAWLRGQWRDSSAVLFDWSSHMLDRAELMHFNANDPDRNPYAQRLRNVFALCVAINLPLEKLVSGRVWRWHRDSFDSDC